MGLGLIPTEHDEQVALVQWWAYACKSFGVPEALLFAIPNGGMRSKAVAGKLKAEGVRPGVPDLFLAVPRAAVHGLFIEMKRTKGGKMLDDQLRMEMMLTLRGYLVSVCYGMEDAQRTITDYLEGKQR